jgi:hypothetical protein
MESTDRFGQGVQYVAGLLFSSDRKRVALIHKNHGPAAVVGKWNAIGGKCIFCPEFGLPPESPAAAMWREFCEEAGDAAGLNLSWSEFLCLDGRGWRVTFFHAFDTEKLDLVSSQEDEDVSIFEVASLPETVPNLRWIIPMALGHADDHVWLYRVVEQEPFAQQVFDAQRRMMRPAVLADKR